MLKKETGGVGSSQRDICRLLKDGKRRKHWITFKSMIGSEDKSHVFLSGRKVLWQVEYQGKKRDL